MGPESVACKKAGRQDNYLVADRCRPLLCTPSSILVTLRRCQDNEIARHLTELGQWERKMEREKNVTERYRRMLEESKTPLAIAQVRTSHQVSIPPAHNSVLVRRARLAVHHPDVLRCGASGRAVNDRPPVHGMRDHDK